MSVDTEGSTLTVYVGMPKSAVEEVLMQKKLLASQVMAVSSDRVWIPMHKDPMKALERATWGAEETMGKGAITNPKIDLLLVRVQFTALGVGHYILQDRLTTGDWKKWRFHEELRVNQDVKNTTGQLLYTASCHEAE